MSDSVVYPNVLWCIENFTPISKKNGPIIPLLKTKWKLKLITYNCVGGDKVQLFLKRLTENDSSTESYFFTFTSISGNEGEKYLEKFMKIPLSSRKLCIWEATLEQMSGCNVSFQYCANFLVSFQPGKDWRNFEGIKFETEEMPFRPSLPVLSQDFEKLLSSGEHADVILTCEDKKFRAHKAILSARSDAFRTMFQNLASNQQDVINITDMEANILESLLRYMYVGEIPSISSAASQDIYRAAVKYGIGCWSASSG